MKIKRISDILIKKNSVRILHISDTHGRLIPLHGKADLIVHSGDFLPDSEPYLLKWSAGADAQLLWARQNASHLKKWLQGTPLLLTMGNHDYLDPHLMIEELAKLGLNNIYILHNKITEFEGINFYGFPYVPAIDGTWNYEKDIDDMMQEVDKMVDVINNNKVDIVVAHSALHGLLDLSSGGRRFGSSVIANAFDYKVDANHMPTHYLHGHIHESHGISIRNGMIISNAAKTQHILEIKL